MVALIPRGEYAPHINFPEFFVDPKIEALLQRLHLALATEHVREVVLNFEKCQWFEILPLARLFALLCCGPRRPTLHIIGPALAILPYYHEHVCRLQTKLDSSRLPAEEKRHIESRIEWFSKRLPEMRMSAGAFLVGWGAFDLLNDHYANCRWYVSREKEVSLSELRDNYLFAYGATIPGQSPISSRIWPFSLVLRSDQEEILTRLNGEEILAGPLRAHTRSRVVNTGSASNIFFFEPFENVFQHAYTSQASDDGAVISMRVISWLLDEQRMLKPAAKRLLSHFPDWYRRYLVRHAALPLMELVVADAGVGIPSTLSNAFNHDQNYHEKLGLAPILDSSQGSWELIRYAFERHSTRRSTSRPGVRGLAWLREKIAELQGGLIHVVSGGVDYVLADYGVGLTELPFTSPQAATRTILRSCLPGTAIRIILPLRKDPQLIDRRPQWRPTSKTDNLLFSAALQKPEFVLLTLPSYMDSEKEATVIQELLTQIAQCLGNKEKSFALVDLEYRLLKREFLERLLMFLCRHTDLHGRVIFINCDRHVASRFETLSAESVAKQGLVFPFFEPDLALHWVGVGPEAEKLLLDAFATGVLEIYNETVKRLVDVNRGFFASRNKSAAHFSFSLDHIEQLVREQLGSRLFRTLEERKAIHRGRFILPLSQKTVSTYIEPHQLFVDSELARLLCRHLAVLLRRRYRDLTLTSRRANFRVLTATRIGRDIAMWMPEGYRSFFIYFDYHLIRPEKPRLLKHLRGRQVVIIVDIISTGSQVDQLLTICGDAGANVLGILSFMDMSPPPHLSEGGSPVRVFVNSAGDPIEHLTFWRSPQPIDTPRADDHLIDPYTLSLTSIPTLDHNEDASQLSILSKERGLRLLADSNVLYFGHFDIFGRHYEFATNLPRLITVPSLAQEEIYRACEDAILSWKDAQHPTAIVLYPDLSNCHILQASLLQRPKIRRALRSRGIRFQEARQGSRALGRRYWLTQEEAEDIRAWAAREYPDGYAILLLDDAASTGETLLALIELARSLGPAEVQAFVIVNRMPHFRTGHHQEIERFAWAASRFACLLHINLPAYTRETCPLCRERSELSFDLRSARSEWFRGMVLQRIQRLELTTMLHPQDKPSDPLSTPVLKFRGFSWDDHEFLSAKDLPGVARAISARLAINDGLPLVTVLDEVFNQPSDEVWRVTAIEIARRTDLQQAQHVESILLDRLISVLSAKYTQRQTAALESLRYFRPEVLLPKLTTITEIVLQSISSDELLAELLLLLRRVFSYRHLPGSEVLDRETTIATMLDEQLARSAPGTVRQTQIARLWHEWQGGPLPQYNFIGVIRDLDSLLSPYRRPGHQLLYRLETYIADEDWTWNTDVAAAIGSALKVIRLAGILVSLLTKSASPSDSDLEPAVTQGTRALKDLRDAIVSQITGGSKEAFGTLREMVDDVLDAIAAVTREFYQHTLDPVQVLRNALAKLDTQFPNTRLEIKQSYQLPAETRIVIDLSLFSEIVQNLATNLRHALDLPSGQIQASFSLELKNDLSGPSVELRVQTSTRGTFSQPEPVGSMTTTDKLHKRAEFYGVEHFISPDSLKSDLAPWDETWTFWRL